MIVLLPSFFANIRGGGRTATGCCQRRLPAAIAAPRAPPAPLSAPRHLLLPSPAPSPVPAPGAALAEAPFADDHLPHACRGDDGRRCLQNSPAGCTRGADRSLWNPPVLSMWPQPSGEELVHRCWGGFRPPGQSGFLRRERQGRRGRRCSTLLVRVGVEPEDEDDDSVWGEEPTVHGQPHGRTLHDQGHLMLLAATVTEVETAGDGVLVAS